jgi:hypothetical protein
MDERRLSKKSAILARMAKDEFGLSWQPTQAELKLFASLPTENPAVCGPNDSDDDSDNNPEQSDKWHPQRSINAKLIRWLCVDRQARDLVDPSGIKIYGAKIIGKLNLEMLVVPFSLLLHHCAVPDETSFNSLEIPRLDLGGSWVGPLMAEGIRVKGDIHLDAGFRAKGEVRLAGAQVGVDLNCSEGKFLNPKKKDDETSGAALSADGISIGGDLLLNSGVRAEGEISIIGAQIGGDLDCAEGEFINSTQKDVQSSGLALSADGISVKSSVFLKSSRFEGGVRLLDARIGATVECDHGEFINPAGEALILKRAIVAGDVFLEDEFRADGQVSLRGARIEGDLYCRRADFTKTDLSLQEASARSIDDADSRWPEPGRLHLNGFIYGLADPRDADTRLRWLALQPEQPFYSQPYLQLAKVLTNAGDESGKTKVLVAMKDQEWTVQRRGLAAQLWRWPFRLTAGYGYDPLRALWEILGLSALGWIIYRRSYLAGGLTPTEKDAYTEFKKSGRPPDHHTKFSPLIYSLENSLPLVKLEQADKWEPDPSSQTLHTVAPTFDNAAHWPRRLKWLQSTLTSLGLYSAEEPTLPRSRANRIGTAAKFVRVFLWVQILLGWLLATLFLAGISGIIKKE